MGRLTNNYEGCNQIILCGNETCKETCEKNQCSSCPINKAIDKLAAYEDIIDNPEKLKIIDELYLERCEEINRLKAELAEARNKTIEEFRSEAINFEDYIEPINESPCGAILMYSGYDITKMIMKISEKLKEVQDVN